MDLTSKLIDFEAGNMEPDEVLELFAHLVKTGLAWELQGMYGRIAKQMLRDGWINKEGNVLEVHGAF